MNNTLYTVRASLSESELHGFDVVLDCENISVARLRKARLKADYTFVSIVDKNQNEVY